MVYYVEYTKEKGRSDSAPRPASQEGLVPMTSESVQVEKVSAGHWMVYESPRCVEVIRASSDPSNRFGGDLWLDGFRGWCVIVDGKFTESFKTKDEAIEFAGSEV